MNPTVTASSRPATIEDVPGVARVLSRSAHEDPFFRWLFPDDALRVAKTRRFFALVAGFGYVPEGDVRVAETRDESEEAPVVRGAALWAPPTTNPEGHLVSLRTWPHWGPLLGRDRLAGFVRVFAEWKLAAPQEPILYLAALGVDPAVAGTGVGAGLLGSGLERANAQGLPVFTHTLDAKTVGFYERFGFRRVREVESPDAGTIYFLLHEPA